MYTMKCPYCDHRAEGETERKVFIALSAHFDTHMGSS